MKHNYDDLPTIPAVSYICTKTQEMEKYESFFIKMSAKQKCIEITAEYRDYEDQDSSSNRQGFLQMVADIQMDADIQAGYARPLIVVETFDSLPSNMAALGIDKDFFEKNTRIIELKYLKRR